MLSKKEIVEKLVAEYKMPIQDKCVTLIQHRKKIINKVKHTLYCNLSNGATWVNEGDISRNYRRAGNSYIEYYIAPRGNREYMSWYFCYHDKYNCMEVAIVTMSGNACPPEGEIREWKYLQTNGNTRYFWFKDSPDIYNPEGNIVYTPSKRMSYSADWPKRLKYLDSYFGHPMYGGASSKEMLRFYGQKTITVYYGREATDIEFWAVPLAYKSMYMSKTTSSAQSKVNELINSPLKPFSYYEEKYIPEILPRQRYDGRFYGIEDKDRFIASFEKINKEWGVIRIMTRGGSYWSTYQSPQEAFNYYTKITKEVARYYISQNNKLISCLPKGDKWEVKGTYAPRDYIMIYNPKDLLEFGNMKYLAPCFGETISVSELISILRHPFYEKMVKNGYNNIVRAIKHVGIAPFFKAFGGTEKRNAPIDKMLNCNKHFLKVLNDAYDGMDTRYGSYGVEELVPEIKALFGDNWPLVGDKKSFEYYIPLLAQAICHRLGRSIGHELNIEDTQRYAYWREKPGEYTGGLTPEVKKNIIKLLDHAKGNLQFIGACADTVKSYKSLLEKPDISEIYQIKTMEEIMRLHNRIVELSTIQRNMAEAEKQKQFNDMMERRHKTNVKKFAYEDDEFMIVVPKTPVEIVNEGSFLHHCVGGYVGRVARGETNILFLRKKSDPYSSFYTIEVGNDNIVRQIHGLCNRWLGNNPEAIPFMVKWVKEKSITCDNVMLLTTAGGYCSNHEMLDPARFGLA